MFVQLIKKLIIIAARHNNTNLPLRQHQKNGICACDRGRSPRWGGARMAAEKQKTCTHCVCHVRRAVEAAQAGRDPDLVAILQSHNSANSHLNFLLLLNTTKCMQIFKNRF
jgi:hypothetical protein